MPIREKSDPYPTDHRAKRPYRVRAGHHLHCRDDAHFHPGEVVHLAPERVAAGMRHLVEPLEPETVAGAPVANVSNTRAIASAPTKRVFVSSELGGT